MHHRSSEDAQRSYCPRTGDFQLHACWYAAGLTGAARRDTTFTDRRHLSDPPLAEDAAQEAFIKAFYGLRRFRAGAAFRPWLLEIVANQARNQRRAGGRYDAVVLRAITAERSQTASHETTSPEASVLASEHRQTVLAALGNLRDEDRLVVAYRFFLELSEAEMAAALGCARGTVKSRLSRALERLRHALAAQSEVGDG